MARQARKQSGTGVYHVKSDQRVPNDHYKGYSMKEGHVAPLMRFGVEFNISEKAAIGLQMNMFSVHLDEPEGLELKKNEFYGIQRIGFQLGARFYL